MEHGQLTNHVRALVAERFRDLGIEHSAIRETILIFGGNYHGRRFQADGAEAIWLVEEEYLKLRTAAGECRTIPLITHASVTLARAA
jgi:hypothetical protein